MSELGEACKAAEEAEIAERYIAFVTAFEKHDPEFVTPNAGAAASFAVRRD